MEDFLDLSLIHLLLKIPPFLLRDGQYGTAYLMKEGSLQWLETETTRGFPSVHIRHGYILPRKYVDLGKNQNALLRFFMVIISDWKVFGDFGVSIGFL
ncbi:MAG: hypothetical protein WC096_09570 [Sphaerochaetaceae bacterium]